MNYPGKGADGSTLPGLPSSLKALDEVTQGWKNASLVFIAGAPSMGCTSLLVQLLRHTTLEVGKQTALFSLQLRAQVIVGRLLCAEIGIPYAQLESGKLGADELSAVEQFVAELDVASNLITIHDENTTVAALTEKCRELREQGVELFLIDNLNRILLDKETRLFCTTPEQALTYIVRQLKTLARDLDAPVLVVAELNRSAANRGAYSSPMLTDLRNSGVIENEADLVLFVHRPEEYGVAINGAGNTEGVAELVIAKNRLGSKTTVRVAFDATCGSFSDLPPAWSQPSWTVPASMDETSFTPNTIRLGSRMSEPPFTIAEEDSEGSQALDEPPF